MSEPVHGHFGKGGWCEACVDHGRELDRPPLDEYSVPELKQQRDLAETEAVRLRGILGRVHDMTVEAGR